MGGVAVHTNRLQPPQLPLPSDAPPPPIPNPAETLEKVVSRLLGADRSAHGSRVELRRRLFRASGVTLSPSGLRFMPSMTSMMDALHHLGQAGGEPEDQCTNTDTADAAAAAKGVTAH